MLDRVDISLLLGLSAQETENHKAEESRGHKRHGYNYCVVTISNQAQVHLQQVLSERQLPFWVLKSFMIYGYIPCSGILLLPNWVGS